MADLKDYQKRFKETEEQKKKIRPFKNFNFLTPHYIEKQKKRFNYLVRRSQETKEESKYWNQYLRIVKDSFNTDNKQEKFSISHIQQLGIAWDILFIYGKKDTGKTWAVAHYIRRLLEEDPNAEILFIRNSKEEVKGFINMMNSSLNWDTWTNGEFIYKKSDIAKKKNLKTLKPCGYFAYASGMGFTRWQGGDYQNLKFWWWDECNSVVGGLTQEVFQSLNVLLSSIIRDKEGLKRVKGVMSGNLLQKSNIFLERLGVSSKTKLKILDVHKDNNPKKEILSRLLYINTGDLFKGIEDQKGLALQFLTTSEFEGLLSNRPELNTTKAQYEELDLKSFKPLFAFVFRHTEETNVGVTESVTSDYVLYTYKVPLSMRIVVWIDRFNVTDIKPGFASLYCNDSIIANSYPMTIPIDEKEEFGEIFIEPLEEYLYLGEIWFGWNGTLEIFEKVWPKLRTKYIKEDTDSI